MFGECKKHLQWGAERARYPVPRLDWFRSLWVDVAPMDFIWGSSFRSVQRSLFDPKKMTWRFITWIYKYLYITCITTQVHSPQWWEVCHIRQITIFGQEPWLRAPQPHRIHEEMLWWPGLSKGKLVGHPEGQSQQNSPMSAIAIEFECYSQYILIQSYIHIYRSFFWFWFHVDHCFSQSYLLSIPTVTSRLWGLSGWMRRNPASPTKKEGHLV